MSERLESEQNGLRCIDYVPEIKNHPYFHPVEAAGGRLIVPQLSQEEVFQRTLENIDNTVSPLLVVDGVTPSLFRNGVSVPSYCVSPDHPLYTVAYWLSERDGAVIAGDFVGLKDENDLKRVVSDSNKHFASVVG